MNAPDSGNREFLAALARIPAGYSEGDYRGRRWCATVRRSADRKRIWLFAEERGGTGTVSFNLYSLRGADVLKPCEMSSQKVIDFVLAYRPYGACG